MDKNRINKKIFLWAKNGRNCNVKNWHYRVKEKFKSVDMNFVTCNNDYILSKSVIKAIELMSFEKYKENWQNNLLLNDNCKLRTYRLFKDTYGVEN